MCQNLLIKCGDVTVMIYCSVVLAFCLNDKYIKTQGQCTDNSQVGPPYMSCKLKMPGLFSSSTVYFLVVHSCQDQFYCQHKTSWICPSFSQRSASSKLSKNVPWLFKAWADGERLARDCIGLKGLYWSYQFEQLTQAGVISPSPVLLGARQGDSNCCNNSNLESCYWVWSICGGTWWWWWLEGVVYPLPWLPVLQELLV